MDFTARTLILDLLTTVRRGAMPVACLVEAGALFGFAENNVRVSLSKLHAGGRVARDERGRYRLGERAAALSRELRSWRRLEELQRPDRSGREWDGEWVGVHAARRGRGAARRRRERALSLLGFRELAPGLDVRPDNLRGGVEAVRARFLSIAEPAEPEAGQEVLVCGLQGLDAATERHARSRWDVAELLAGYRSWQAKLAESRSGLEALPMEEAMAETFLVGGGVVRFLHLDPLLPVAILDPRPRQALVKRAREYDELGRSLWSTFLSRHGVPNFGSHRGGWRAPLGTAAEETLQEISRAS